MSENEKNLMKLKGIIGDSLYKTVCDKMGGDDLHLPMFLCGFTSIEERNAQIKRDYLGGADSYSLSKKYNGLSAAQITKIAHGY